MSVATAEQLGTEQPLTQVEESAELAPELLMFAAALGLDPNAKNPLQRPDVDYLAQMARLPINFGAMPSGTDVEGMRRWVDDTFIKGELAKHRAQHSFQYRRPVRETTKEIVTISPNDDGENAFDLWVYEVPTQETSSRPAILMFHGGGWIHGNPAGDEGIAEIFASELDAVVFGVDYRLAPEYKFPAPLDSCEEALQWVARNASKYNIDTTRIALFGVSAGANLAASLALKLSDPAYKTETPKPCFASLVVPVTACPEAYETFVAGRSFPRGEKESLFEKQVLPEVAVKEFESLYVLYTGSKENACHPLASPLLSQPTSNYPPTDITVAACDALREQGQAFAELLRQAGVTVTEDVLSGVPHMFNLPTDATVTKTWLRRQVDLLEGAFSA